MKIVLQRVRNASVTVRQHRIADIGQGLLLFVGFGHEHLPDGPSMADRIKNAVSKIIHLRVFSNAEGKLDYSLVDIGGAVLVVPQFTLYGQAKKGRRPDFTASMPPPEAELCFEQFVSTLRASGISQVEIGQFGTDMRVSLTNDGPFTLLLTY